MKRFKAYLSILCLLFFTSNVVAQNYPSVFDLKSLNGHNGFSIKGLTKGDRLGEELAFIGDINNDGFDDLCVTSEYANKNGFYLGGTAYIIFGSDKPFASTFDLNTLNGSNGFKVEGIAEDERRGKFVKGLGDINNDGIGDLVIGTEQEKVMILYGKAGSFPATMTVNDINGNNGFIIDIDGVNECWGAGDINGDGIEDMLLGHPHWSGETLVFFGKNGNFPASIDESFLDGTRGFRLSEISYASRSAYLVGPAGDINNDGYDDIIVGLWANSFTTDAPSKTYVFFGKPGPYSPLIDINKVNGTDGFAIINYELPSFLKWVGKLGDINGDGIDDLFSFQNILYGSSKPFPAVVTKDNSLDGVKGFMVPGISQTAAAAGDLNFDGIGDFIAVAKSNEVWAIYGTKETTNATFDPAALNGVNGFRIQNLSQSNIGRQISGDQDFNGDGHSDFAVGSGGTEEGGTVYVVFGGDHYTQPLIASYPLASNITFQGFNLEVKASEKGVVHYAIYKGNPNTITDANIILEGTNSIAFGNIDINITNQVISKVIAGLEVNTSYDIYLYQEDESENVGQIYKLDDVKTLPDTEAPIFTCPGDQKLDAAILPDYRENIEVTDNTDENPLLEQTPAAGTVFADGMTVTIKTTDKFHNIRTCTFKVNSFTTSIRGRGYTSVDVFPNPVKSLINVEGIMNYRFMIINSTGQICMEGLGSSSINVEMLNKGIYTILIYSEDGSLMSQKKLIKE
ncbi:T9SS type A sorting domain-containing protein [Sporocytophaga sp.]|uniref:T9SS type A sorting domain-containing protein n=1 Tax=Sporocytophaga sp. TaxID=2231183 RepID=UPI0025E50DD9|nr:T9SS type A sorting domain-containing protein [Sporocytophaga sp.]